MATVVFATNNKNAVESVRNQVQGKFSLLHGGDSSLLAAIESEKKEGREPVGGIFELSRENLSEAVTLFRSVLLLLPDSFWIVVAPEIRSLSEVRVLFGKMGRFRWGFLRKFPDSDETVELFSQLTALWEERRRGPRPAEDVIAGERQAAVAQLARGLGHELGNVFLKLNGYLELAQMGEALDRVKEDLNSMAGVMAKGILIARNLQMVSKRVLAESPVDLRAVIDEAIQLMGGEFRRTGSKVALSTDPSLASVRSFTRGDAKALTQVFQNILLNAAHSMSGGGVVSIRLDSTPAKDSFDGWAVVIQDSGAGIAPEVMPRIFDFGFSTKGSAGVGIGLCVSRGIVEAMGGRIAVRSTVGLGTEVTVFVPKLRD